MRKASGILCFFISLILCVSASFAADLSSFAEAMEDRSLDDIIKNIQSNQSKIKDMYAETTTKITSNIKLPTSKDAGPQKMVQKGKMWTKGEGKSKIEMLSPMKQVTITNGDQMAIINPETGQKMIQDLKKLREKSGGQAVGQSGGQMSLEKAREYFKLSVSKKGDDYVIVGVPKEANKFLGKMEFYVDGGRWVPVKITMYDAKGRPMSQSEIVYQEFPVSYSEAPNTARSEGVWVPVKNFSNVTTPAGNMKVEMAFENIKINKGISDKEFAVE